MVLIISVLREKSVETCSSNSFIDLKSSQTEGDMRFILLLLIHLSFLYYNMAEAQHIFKNQEMQLSLTGPYLGQKAPGSIPIRFAKGVVSTSNYEYGGVFSPDMKSFYFIANGGQYAHPTFVVFQDKNNGWEKSEISSGIGQPTFSPNGKIMHLGKRYLELNDTMWSELKTLEAPFKNIRIMRLSESIDGTYFFDTYDEENPEFPIRYSRKIDGKYENPKVLGKAINSGRQLNHPFIAPDESYLIWDAIKAEGYGDSDIYISFKQEDGSWGEALNLGDKVNTEAWEACASVTPDGKYLFFNRNIGSKNYEDVDIFLG